MWVWVHVCMVVALSAYSVTGFARSQISITAERIEHAQGDVKNLSITLNADQSSLQLQTRAQIKLKSQTEWAQLSLGCELSGHAAGSPEIKSLLNCRQGQLQSARINLPFSLRLSHAFSQGKADLEGQLDFNNASFSDEAGLHAAEKLMGNVQFNWIKVDRQWQWRSILNWQSGEVFWQPFYLVGNGHQLSAGGKWQDTQLQLDTFQLQLTDIGTLSGSGRYALDRNQITDLRLHIPDLNLETAYPVLLKPLLEKTAFADLKISGNAAMNLELANAEPKSFEFKLKNAEINDQRGKFAFTQLNANIPWDYNQAKPISLSYASGELLNLPLGETKIEGVLDRYALTSPDMRLPILDGALHLSDISAARRLGKWYWHLKAQLEPVSMARFTAAMHLPKMAGRASAEIPMVTYADGQLTTDGNLLLHVFNGTATVSNLTMQSPLGVAPKLNAEIRLRDFDLDALTHTFSFGAIEGKLDGDIKNLELQNWKPVKFDAVVQSSPGSYRKKISQRAVENISALGGGGAAAAVQRSFLRFFEQFNYGKMGLSCRLRNDVCEMGGIESTPYGYMIVKGSGIPAITVMGYNRNVGWTELLARIKRVTDGNSGAVIQ